jgi:hypothetical protein
MEERETFFRSTCLTKSSFRSRRNFAFPRSSGRPRIIQIESMEKGECESIELEHQNEDSLRGEDELHLGSLMELEKNLSETRARLSSAIELHLKGKHQSRVCSFNQRNARRVLILLSFIAYANECLILERKTRLITLMRLFDFACCRRRLKRRVVEMIIVCH